MSDSNEDLGHHRDHLINRTADTEDLTYTSQLVKRKTIDDKWAEQEETKRLRIMKIILLAILAILAITGLIIVLIAIGNRKGGGIESRQDYNMFTVKDVTPGNNKYTLLLQSKLKQASSNDAREIETTVGTITETDDNKFVDNLQCDIMMISGGLMRTTFKDIDNPDRWDLTKIPGFMPDRQPDPLTQLDSVGFSVSNANSDFSIKLTDQVSNYQMLDTTNRALVFTDKYIEIGMTLPTQVLFGLGQHNSKFLLSPGNWTMFNRDQPGSPIAEGEGKQHLYGTHPFLMVKTKDNKFQGVLFYNSNPQQVYIEFSSTGTSVITYRTIGGILDIYTFAADTADNIIRKYNNLVGLPALPPFWSLGFHQCSWAYNTTQMLVDVVNNYTSNGYMFDAIWADIEYMDNYIDFTVDDVKFAGLKDFINGIHANHNYFVPIVDAGISIAADSKGVNWYEVGKKSDVFIKTSKNPNMTDNGDLIARVWPGYTAFVDFLNPKATAFWSQGLDALFNLIPFDGIWLDMNEPSNFCTTDDNDAASVGECYPKKGELKSWKGVERELGKTPKESPVKPGAFDNVPFKPGQDELWTKTISMDAYMYDPNTTNPTGNYVMYNIHNLYGTLETKATHDYLSSKSKKRQLIISRDSFVGHGQYGSIWTGDNDATWDHMKLSINQIMNFNMFGMPFVGGDICGFGGNTTPELCARWAQVGSFYPFMRNHYANDSIPHEFYRYDEKYQTGMKEAIRQRYSLLRYYYTQLYKSSTFGDPTVRHPLYDWPSIKEMVADENSFMIGKAIRVIANFNQDDKTPFIGYLPQGRWLDLKTYVLMDIKGTVEKTALYAGFDYVNIHVRGGSIVPIQDTSAEAGLNNTYDLLENQIRLLIVPTENGYAEGNHLVARGETTDENYQYFTMTYSNKRLHIRLDRGDPTDTGSEYNEVLEEIHIIDGNPDTLKADFACAITADQTIRTLHVEKANRTVGDISYLRIFGGVNTIEFDETHTIVFGTSGVDENICNRAYVATQQSSSSNQQIYTLSKNGKTAGDKDLTLTLSLLEQNNIELKITDSTKRFEVPRTALKNGGPQLLNSNDEINLADYVTVSNSTSQFSLQIHEYQNNANVYFDISGDSLMFTDYYIGLETNINTNGKLYGVGERITDFFVQDGIYTSWAMDQTDPVDDGKPPGKNIYGTHPVYFTKAKTGSQYHWGMFNLNSDAQDTKVQLSTGKLGGTISHYISGQGIIDMFFFIENVDPESAVKKYHNLIGHTLLPPFWGLGWNQCKYGYENTTVLEKVYLNYTENDFPLDVLWSDIDHMYKYRDFTYDKDANYKGLDTFITSILHHDNRRYVPIIDAGIAIVNNAGEYGAFDSGKSKGVFIKSGARDDVLYGKVWPGSAAFPDWSNPATTDWWTGNMKKFHDEIAFDGIWLDMDEVANFCTGPCIPEDVVAPEKSIMGKLIYSPGSRSIEEKCLSVDGKHSDGWTEFNYHSLFGFMQGIATQKYFSDQNLRPFIISRSTYAGQGKYTSHWLGDNFSEEKYIKYSISGILSLNVFGVNFVGADICGFLGITDEQLCQIWTNVGAFYPFARNHNDINDKRGQEPYRWSVKTQATMRNSLRWRYAVLRYYYTEMYLTSTQGGVFWKPLFFEYPNDNHAYDDVERNIMIGPALKFSPMIHNSTASTESFIMPSGKWCNIIDYSCISNSKLQDVSLPTTPDKLNLHLRPGYIMPLQRDAVTHHINTTVDLENMPMGLILNPTDVNKATGMFYADDGETLNNNAFTLIKMDFTYDGKNHAEMKFTSQFNGYTSIYTKLKYIEILGVNYSNLYKCKKMSINKGTIITGTFDSGKRLLTFTIDEPVEMTQITQIDFDA